MEVSPIVNNSATIRRDFISELEHKIDKQFLTDWAMGWMLDIAIETVLLRNIPENELFVTIFTIWREKCMELSDLVLTHDDAESHLYAGIDLDKISPELCQRWRTRFAHLSSELGIS